MKKSSVLILGLLICIAAFPQSPREMNIGGFVGSEVLDSDFGYFPVAATLEYRPGKASFSLNTDFQLLFNDTDFLLTVPLYLKIILGNKFRVCPESGGFFRTNGNYGWMAGLSIEYQIKKLLLFAKADYYLDAYKEYGNNHFGPGVEYTTTSSSVWVSLGVKWNILK